VQKGESENEIIIYRNPEILEAEIGIASYYADEFHNKETYNGEIYDMYGISAAHPSYPMDTIVKITNLVNNKSIELRINDRMPYREDRIIDLSYGAAKFLDMITNGITKVKVEVLKWGEGRK
jgi:rare lipoprotein A